MTALVFKSAFGSYEINVYNKTYYKIPKANCYLNFILQTEDGVPLLLEY